MAVISGASFDYSGLTGVINKTLPKIDKDVKDSIFTIPTFTRYLKSEGAFKYNETGDGVMFAFEMARNSTAEARGLNQEIDLVEQDIHRWGKESYGEYSGAIPVDYVTLQKNSGPEKLIAYLESHKTNLEKTLAYKFNYDLCQGSGTFPHMYGIDSLIATSPSSGTIHGISRSSESWVRNQQRGATCSTTNGFGEICLYDVDVLLKAASKGMGDRSGFKLCLTDKTVHSNMVYYLPGLNSSIQRFIIEGNSKVPADGTKYGEEVTYYLGGAKVIWDNDAPSDSMRWINPDYIQVRVLKGCDFVTARRQSYNSFSDAIIVGVVASFINTNPYYSAVLNAFSS
jgi:hypothetical protein